MTLPANAEGVGGRPDHTFGCRCRRHLPRAWNRPEHWSVEEVGTLEARYGHVSDESIARRLGRTVVAVGLKAKRLGLRKRDAGLSGTEVGRLLGVDPTTVLKVWIPNGLLKVRRGYAQGPHRTQLTTEAAVFAFIRDHGQWIDAERVPVDSPFRAAAMANRWVSLTELTQITGHARHWLMWYLRSGLMPTARKGTHWYIPAAYVEKLPKRAPDAIEYSRWCREQELARRNAKRKGIAA